jgi:hypothetical protein
MDYIIKYTLICIALITLLVIPETFLYNGNSICIFKNLTGIQCPLCGMTRASSDLLHLRIGSALHYNPVSILLPFLLLFEIIGDVFPSYIPRRYNKTAYVLFIICLGLLFIVRIANFFIRS